MDKQLTFVAGEGGGDKAAGGARAPSARDKCVTVREAACRSVGFLFVLTHFL